MPQDNFHGIDLYGKMGIPSVYLNPNLNLVSQGYPAIVKLKGFSNVDRVFHKFTYDEEERRKILSQLRSKAPQDATIAVLGNPEDGNNEFPVQFYRIANPR